MGNKKTGILNGITLNIILLGLVSLLTDLSSQMVFPLIPLYLTTVLGAGASIVGIVEGAAESTASLLKVVSGYWSDKIKKRKPFVLFGYSLSAVTKPLFAFAGFWGFVLLIRVVERIGKGIRDAPRDAIIAESCEQDARGKAYGFHRAMDGIGSIAGAVLAFLLLPIFGYRNIFLFAFLPGIMAVFVILFVKEKNTLLATQSGEKVPKAGFKELPKNLRKLIIATSIFAIGHFGYAFLLLKANNIGLLDDTAILLYVLFYLVYSIFTIPAGALSDKTGRKPVMIVGYILFIMTSLVLIFTSDINALTIGFIMYGIFYATIDAVQRAFVVDLAPKHLKATALGMFHTAIGLAALPGGFIAGFLWDKINPGATFIYGIIITVISLTLFATIDVSKDK